MPKYYSAKYERVFFTIMINERDHTLMENLLSEILEGEVKILEYPRTQLKVKSATDKAKVSDCLIRLNGELIHLELETGVSEATKVKNLSNFFNIYS